MDPTSRGDMCADLMRWWREKGIASRGGTDISLDSLARDLIGRADTQTILCCA